LIPLEISRRGTFDGAIWPQPAGDVNGLMTEWPGKRHYGMAGASLIWIKAICGALQQYGRH